MSILGMVPPKAPSFGWDRHGHVGLVLPSAAHSSTTTLGLNYNQCQPYAESDNFPPETLPNLELLPTPPTLSLPLWSTRAHASWLKEFQNSNRRRLSHVDGRVSGPGKVRGWKCDRDLVLVYGVDCSSWSSHSGL
jgi:hypothetical protein